MKKSFLFFTISIFIVGTTLLQDATGRSAKQREYPNEYLKKTIQIFLARNGKNIVEIGSLRKPLTHAIDQIGCANCMDGHSTAVWAHTLANVYTVDIDPENTKITKEVCRDFKNVHAYTADGIEFLKKFDKPIDLLFLDAWDVLKKTPYAEKHLEAYLAAKHRLHEKSLILIDDTNIKKGGKGKLVIPQALKDGYKIVFGGRQTLLART